MRKVFVAALAAVILTACSSGGQAGGNTYTQISQETAKEMMAKDDGHIVVDVRREDEYAAGHIPGAVLISNESIGNERPAELPDLDQIILVYCRSGNRSKQAAEKLAKIGYTNIYEFGGISSWTGDVVTSAEEIKIMSVTVPYRSFDGGGPEYTVTIEDPTVAVCEITRKYDSADHEEIDGAGCAVNCKFTGLAAGETKATISARSPIAENFDDIYRIRVGEDLTISLELIETVNLDEIESF